MHPCQDGADHAEAYEVYCTPPPKPSFKSPVGPKDCGFPLRHFISSLDPGSHSEPFEKIWSTRLLPQDPVSRELEMRSMDSQSTMMDSQAYASLRVLEVAMSM